jgi:hypothetical protein
MSTQEFKEELRNLNLKVGDQILLKWAGAVVNTSIHTVTAELLFWISKDEIKKSTGLIANPLEDGDGQPDFFVKEVDFGSGTFFSVEGTMPMRTIPLTIKYPGEKEETNIEEATLVHIISVTLKR